MLSGRPSADGVTSIITKGVSGIRSKGFIADGDLRVSVASYGLLVFAARRHDVSISGMT